MQQVEAAGSREAGQLPNGLEGSAGSNLNSEIAAPAQAPAYDASSAYDKVRDEWDERIGYCGSYERTRELALGMLNTRDPRRRLQRFGYWGNLCDAPWGYRSLFADMLRRAVASVGLADVLDPDEREWFRSLPEQIGIYRGCEHGRVRGLSWTTEERIARKFARGMRCYNDQPTLVSAIIPKQHVLFLFLSRNEHEVVVDPRRLRQIKIEVAS